MAKKVELVKEEVMVDVNIQSVDLVIDREPVIVVDKNPLHTKFQKFIEQANSGYIVGFDYGSAMEVLRFCERKRNIQLGINMSCASCLIDLLKMFDSLKEV